MSFLTVVEMGYEDVLGQVDREIAEEDVQRGARTFPQDFGQDAEQGHRQHEAGAECETGIDEAQAAPEMLHHGERANHIAYSCGQTEDDRTQISSCAKASRVSRALSSGRSSTRSSR